MPRMEGRARPLRDPENMLIEYWVVRGRGVFKCDCCDRGFDSLGWLLDAELRRVPLVEAWGRDDTKTHYGARIVEAVRVRFGEDFEYKPGEWYGWACPVCTAKIEREWVVMPGEAPDA